MTVYSMTGYASVLARGASDADLSPGGAAPAVSVELRSVNGRFLDLSFKMPDELRGVEPALREMLAAGLRRGKVEMRIAVRAPGGGASSEEGTGPTPAALERVARLQAQVQAQLPQARAFSVHEALQWCRDTVTMLPGDDAVLDAAAQCLQALRESRRREGEKLTAVLLERTRALRELAARAGPLVPQVVQRQQARFLERWREALEGADAAGGKASGPGAAPPGPGTLNAQALQERALQEAATYAIRIDVAEELSRLIAHLDEIERLLARGGELGKRLDFLIQELHREANTLGSKSAALELTGISVEMKVLVEQLREQVQNIE
ncbi:MAG: YicC family protein [Rubrivivax sp.]